MIQFVIIAFVTFLILGVYRESRAASAPIEMVLSYAIKNARLAPLWVGKEQDISLNAV